MPSLRVVLPGAVKQFVFLCLCFTSVVHAEVLTLPLDQRPGWLSRDGIVMAGNWEPLLFRIYQGGSDNYTPTAEQLAAYRREQSPEMIAQLKELGINFIMTHCYKGMGLEMERESMADAVKFTRLCHDAGIRVGVYCYSGAFLWEPFFKEVPQARDWLILDKEGKPRIPEWKGSEYRYFWDRNHPDAQAFFRPILRFAVEDIKADLIHFDNYRAGPGSEANSVKRFRQYLRDTFTSERLKEMGIDDLNTVQPPLGEPLENLFHRAWADFSCQSLSDSYHDMSRYARTLRKDILMECNPGGPGNYLRASMDHGRQLQGGEAFWREGHSHPGFKDGKLVHTRIRDYKVARRMNNMAFTYNSKPLSLAESMAFSLDCLGHIYWFQNGKISPAPEKQDDDLGPFIRFFHKRRDLLRDAEVVADVAVLRSFPSQVFGDWKYVRLPTRAEQILIENCVCFQIIYDQHLDDLKRYRVLVLAGCVALSDKQIRQIEQYVESGGRVCIVGPVATHDEWMIRRDKPTFADLPESNVIRIPEDANILASVHQACGDELSLSVKAEPGLCMEFTEQTGRRLVHLVNYRIDKAVKNIVISLRLPAGRHVTNVMLAGPQREHDLKLPFREQACLITFTVPEVKIYEIAVVAMK
jgi:hypothetical protein